MFSGVVPRLPLLLTLLAVGLAASGCGAQGQSAEGVGKPRGESKRSDNPSSSPDPTPATDRRAADDGPIYGLPLEYNYEIPEVPERLLGPTPMDALPESKEPEEKSKETANEEKLLEALEAIEKAD